MKAKPSGMAKLKWNNHLTTIGCNNSNPTNATHRQGLNAQSIRFSKCTNSAAKLPHYNPGRGTKNMKIAKCWTAQQYETGNLTAQKKSKDPDTDKCDCILNTNELINYHNMPQVFLRFVDFTEVE
ncbi:hypothetical protein VNO77_29945 [Canavalia gladiata]|uniref:Uncharacterized protein n=1 Tax=Canavalia gladiata TaxID=3824 RepID=A0AAN9KQK5_CANGL